MKLKILIIFLLLIPFLTLPLIIKIKKINCRSQFGVCGGNLEESMVKVKGWSLLKTKKLLNHLLQKSFQIDSFSIQYKFPDTLEVNVIEKKVLFGLRATGESLFFLVDQEGMIVYQSENTNLPIIEVEKNTFDVGQKVSDEEFFALKILDDMVHLYEVNLGRIQGGSLIIKGENLASGVFPLNGDEKALVGAFRLINEQLNSRDQNSRIDRKVSDLIIDLRFKNPVIR